MFVVCFLFTDTATTAIYTLSLHDALPIFSAIVSAAAIVSRSRSSPMRIVSGSSRRAYLSALANRSEEHTSELQSRLHLVCRLLLEKKNKHTIEHGVIDLSLIAKRRFIVPY